jgi:hypothetical protein
MASQGLVEGLTITEKDKKFCLGCAYGKQHRSLFSKNKHRERLAFLGDLVHIDLCGPISTPTVGGARYFILFKDDSLGYKVIECLKTKPELFDTFK